MVHKHALNLEIILADEADDADNFETPTIPYFLVAKQKSLPKAPAK